MRKIKLAKVTPIITVVYSLFSLKLLLADEKSAITKFFIEYLSLFLKLLLLNKLPKIGSVENFISWQKTLAIYLIFIFLNESKIK